ncbi:MAG: hypothetical protein QXJ99_01860 [Thermofilum sp.]
MSIALVVINISFEPLSGKLVALRGASLIPRIAAALASSLAYLTFCSLVGIEASLLPLLAGLSALSPNLSPLISSMVIGASLYLGGGLKMLLLFTPVLLLVVYKGLQSWHSALFLQLLSVLMLVSGGYAAALLGLLYALSSAEEPRAAAATGLVFSSQVFVLSGFLLPGDTWLCSLVRVPGGLAALLDKTPFDVVNVGQFYLALLEKLLKDPYMAASYTMLAASALLSALLAEEVGRVRSSIAAPLLLSVPALYGANAPLLELGRQVLTVAAASGLASLAATPGWHQPRRLSLSVKTPPPREKRKSAEDLLFEDLKPYTSLVLEECLKGKYSYLLLLGLSLEDERALRARILSVGKCAAKIVLFHEHGAIPQGLSPENTLVFYIPPLSLEEAVSLLSRLSGYPQEAIESLDSEFLNVLKYLDRTALLEIAGKADKLIAGGSPAKRAFEKAISEASPKFTPEVAVLIEEITSLYPTIGFRRTPFRHF